MTDRHFRLALGLVLLGLLYYDAFSGVSLLISYLVFEAITNLRIPRLVQRLSPVPDCPDSADGLAVTQTSSRFSIEAEQVWRLCVASLLSMSVVFYPESLWWLAWFIAFTVLGAGVSGVCPLLNGLRLARLR
jgi:hypothetical protein